MWDRVAFGCWLALTLAPSAAHAQSRPAQCLVEVQGVHYLGGPCTFLALDRLGSFRVSDVRPSGLVAQVNVQKKDEGKATWSGPLGQASSGLPIGDVSRNGGCWMTDDTRICAWGASDKVYLGPSPKEPSPNSFVFYGSRVGMYDDVVSRRGLDTANAEVVTKPSKDGAVTFCREYGFDYSLRCIDEQMQRTRSTETLKANCRDRTFVGFGGRRFAFLGRAAKGDETISATYKIKDLELGEILDGSSASGYGVALGTYQALCPETAPKGFD